MPRLQKRPLPDESLQSPTLGLCRRWCWQIGGQSDILEQVELPLRGARDHHMDIEAWLQGLGLERYAPAFRDNEIDWEVLPKLTSEDLREIGVAAVGHRRKLLGAIAALGASAPTAALTAAVSGASGSSEAERRQLTVMFCDLVGSTPLSTRFDPEDLREIVGAYHRCVADTVGRFGGFVARYMGDGVLVYFGYPEAHEDDAERAARAGLAVIDAVGRLATQEPLNVRIGIASGLVVVGDLIGAGAAQERDVVGETPNLAARLQALARPGTLVVADSTRRQIGTLFEIEDLGPQPLAGFAEPQPAWRVVGESGVTSRFEALRSGTTPLVGRDEELDLLTRRWQQAKSGAGRVVLISGEPGIGKSRLTAALSQGIETEPHTRIRYFCSPHDQDSALYPFIGQLERAAGFTRDDTTATRLDKLEALLGDGAEPGDMSLIAEMLSLSGGDRFPPLDLSPQRKKERTLAALLRQLQALTRRQPVLMIFEDLHWIDPTSREVLDLTVEKITGLPVLLVATYRPEFQPPWVSQSQVTVIALNRLGRSEGATLVRRLAGNLGALPPDIVEEIVERTDGVPLFVEELTKAVVEAGADRGYASISAVPSSSLAVPATLHASLLGRLDRLGTSAKNVAQVGAAIGRDFSHELLAAAAPLAEPELQEALRRLVEAGLVFQRGLPPAAEYLFKHALVQDTAYSTLMRGPRQALHRRIAEAMEQRFPDFVETRPEIVALHYGEAALPDKAITYWHLAGKLSVAKSAVREATAQLRRGLILLDGLAETPERKQLGLDIHVTLTQALMAGKGYADPETAAALERANRLVTETASVGTPVHFFVLFGLWVSNFTGGAIAAALEHATNFLSSAQSQPSSGPLLVGHCILALSLMRSGDYPAALAHLETAVSLHRPDGHRDSALRYGQDIEAEPGDLSLIAEMLSLSGGERFPPLDLSPQRKKERTLAALLRQLQALARRQPVLMIFEDLHWIDPTSRELLDLTVEKITDLPVLLVATYRPEFQPPWVGGSQVTVIALNRLGRSEGATLVHRLAGNLGALPPDIVDEIVERSDGVPLFVEELTKAMVEAGADRGYRSISAAPPSSLAVPATLHASLLGRLDRLGPSGKIVAQVGAAIGRDFSYELLAAAAPLAEPELQEALRRLVETRPEI